MARKATDTTTRSAARRQVRCYLCGNTLEVSTKTLSTTCPKCHKAIKVEDIVIKNYLPVNDVQTCGKITVTRKGRIAAKRIQSGDGVFCEGIIEGKLETPGLIELGPKAAWKGATLCSATLTVQDGASLNGYITVPMELPAEDVATPATAAGDAVGESAAAPPPVAATPAPVPVAAPAQAPAPVESVPPAEAKAAEAKADDTPIVPAAAVKSRRTKTAAKKPATKKTATAKSNADKPEATKSAATQPAAKSATTKPATKKTTAKKTTAKKTPAKKTATKKTATKNAPPPAVAEDDPAPRRKPAATTEVKPQRSAPARKRPAAQPRSRR